MVVAERKYPLTSFLTYLGLEFLGEPGKWAHGTLVALKVSLIALKVAHFPDVSSPDGMDICQRGEVGQEALLGGERVTWEQDQGHFECCLGAHIPVVERSQLCLVSLPAPSLSPPASSL